MYLVMKRDIASFMKRNEGHACCSMDFHCFACGKDKQANNERSLNGVSAAAKMADDFGVVPILSDGLILPEHFERIIMKKSNNDWRGNSLLQSLPVFGVRRH